LVVLGAFYCANPQLLLLPSSGHNHNGTKIVLQKDCSAGWRKTPVTTAELKSTLQTSCYCLWELAISLAFQIHVGLYDMRSVQISIIIRRFQNL
jgi:hypothetical protein